MDAGVAGALSVMLGTVLGGIIPAGVVTVAPPTGTTAATTDVPETNAVPEVVAIAALFSMFTFFYCPLPGLFCCCSWFIS